MKMTKSPVLTSPWKIGFFVSLMLVFVSIGVSYYFVHQYGVPLNILERDWLDRNEWLGVIRGEGFLFEVLPLIGLVIATAMISYMVITATVRKYKKYLDSGHDYKNLLSSLKEIEDLENKKKIERIKNHPELKRLLLGVAEALEERERLLSEREGALETRLNDVLASKEKEMGEDFARQCDRLSKAVEARSLEPSAIEFANPDLARLSKVVQQALQANAAPAASDLAASYGDLKKTTEVFQSKLREIAEELRTSRASAQEIEQQLRGLAQADSSGPDGNRLEPAAKEAREILGSLKGLEELSAAIELTAEEARGVAINTALRAGSGEGTQDDLIRLAEDVKEVASRFKDATKRFFQISAVLRSSAGALEVFANSPKRPSAGPSGVERNVTTVLSRVSLWVERIVVLCDRVANLSESYGVAVSTLPVAPLKAARVAHGAEPQKASVAGVAEPDAVPESKEEEEPALPGSEESEEFGFETLDRSRSFFIGKQMADEPENAPDERIQDERVSDGDEEHEGERGDEREVEKRREGVFEEMTARPLGSAGDDASENDPLGKEPAEKTPPEEKEETIIELLRPVAMQQDTKREISSTRSAGTAEADLDVVGLYDLGAVDYDPALHG